MLPVTQLSVVAESTGNGTWSGCVCESQRDWCNDEAKDCSPLEESQNANEEIEKINNQEEIDALCRSKWNHAIE